MKKLILFLLLIFSNQLLFAKEFKEINKLLSEKYDNKTWKKVLEEELKIYEEKKLKKNLLQAKYIEAFISGNEGDDNNRISKLLWIIEHSQKEDQDIYTYSNYHLASTLSNVGSNNLALRYSRESLKKCLQNKNYNLLPLNYSLEGVIYYKLKNYEKAIEAYFKALKNKKTKDYLFSASMLNNISLCKMNQHKLDESNVYIQKSLNKLSKIQNPNFEVITFKIIVEGNLGTNYFIQKRYKEAKPLLENEIAFYKKHQINLSAANNPLEGLLKIYSLEKNIEKKKETLNTILSVEKSLKNKSEVNRFTKIMYDYYAEINDYKNLKIYSNKLVFNTNFVSDSIVANLGKLNNSLYTQRINHLKTQFSSNNKLLNSTIREKQNTTIFLLILVALVIFIFVLVFIEKARREKRNKVIMEQNKLLEEKRRIILENELKLKQEKITSLALNLNLKKETEKAFLEKIKEIKRKRTVDIESVLRDLQLSVNNLLQIDNKNIINNQESDAENLKFINLLKEKHPTLSELELSLCAYFRMNLNSKEIASLVNMVSGTIRVKKTKIKAKIGLNEEENLNDYLTSLIETN